MGKATIRKVKEAFDRTDEPFAMLAILRKEIARQYLVGPVQKAYQTGKGKPPQIEALSHETFPISARRPRNKKR